jgi:hypothetical protein
VTEQDTTPQLYNTFLAQYEGLEGITDEGQNTDQFTAISIEDYPYDDPYDVYLTDFGEINGIQAVSILNDQSAYHMFTKDDVFKSSDNQA